MSTVNPENMRYAWRRLVVRDADLTDATRRVLFELESYADPDGTNAHPGVDLIASELRTTTKAGTVNEKTVRRALKTGVERGYIECTRKGGGGQGKRNNADTYRLTLPLEKERVDGRAVVEDADQLDTGDHERDMNGPHTEQTDGTVDIQVSGVQPETVDTQMSTVHTDTVDIPSPNGGHAELNTGRSDVPVPDPLHQVIYQEGEGQVTDSPTEPADSDNISRSAPTATSSTAADFASIGCDGLSRNCALHPNGTTVKCWDCRDARKAFEEAKAAMKRAEVLRMSTDKKDRAKAFQLAVDACDMCDADGYRNHRICHHRPDQDRVNAEGKAEVQAAIEAARRKREENGQRPRVDAGGRATRGTAKSIPRQAVRSFRSGSDTGRAASRAELGRLKPAPMPTGLGPDSAVRADGALQASVA